MLLRLPGVFLLRLDKASLSSLLLKDAPRSAHGPDTPAWKIGRAPQGAPTLPAAKSVYRGLDQQATRMGRRLTKKTFVHTFKIVNIAWDPKKAAANVSAHGVSFADAATVLSDDRALTREDRDTLGEQCLLAYVYGQLAEHGLSKVTDDGVKFVILAALNLVECIAEAAKLRAGS